ncbi:MAG: methionine adenosyltransferase [Acidobacteria bacterium]|nr:methionine adenosyltransferase [Acidobacteriota bacterium]
MRSSGKHLFTSESVTEGHPDKIADQVSDAVLDAVLKDDPMGRVACETMVTTGLVVVAGEISTKADLDIQSLVRETIRDVGYTRSEYGFDCDTCGVVAVLDRQSGDIAMGVDTGGAGDQGLMFGYACDETPELMPMPIQLAQGLVQALSQARRQGRLDYLRPDGKSQVTIEYDGTQPRRIEAVVVSTQHGAEAKQEQIREDVIAQVIRPVLPEGMLDNDTKIYVNPTGRFVTGGPQGDCGLTGRKIIVDTYGGMARHGGGAFSGKDPTKVDRSASYMARYIAKNIVAAKLARRAEVQLAYAIGVAEPVSVMVDSFGSGQVADTAMEAAVRKTFELTPKGIIESLNLRRPIFRATAAFGHFGRNGDSFTWERTDKAEALAAAVR